jgi:hypothetical protein
MVLSSTEGSTVPWRLLYNSIYIFPLLCCAYSTHGDVKYWECHSTLEASVQQCYYCSTLPSSTVTAHCTVLAVFFIVVISLHFTRGVFPVVMLVGAFVSCLLSHIFFLLFCITIRKIVTTSGVVCLNVFVFQWNTCFFSLRASIECIRQSDDKNPIFGGLREILIDLSESNKVDLPVLVLFVSCQFACSRVVYTQGSCRTILM